MCVNRHKIGTPKQRLSQILMYLMIIASATNLTSTYQRNTLFGDLLRDCVNFANGSFAALLSTLTPHCIATQLTPITTSLRLHTSPTEQAISIGVSISAYLDNTFFSCIPRCFVQ